MLGRAIRTSYARHQEAETLQLAGYRASSVDSEILTARTCFIHVYVHMYIPATYVRSIGNRP